MEADATGRGRIIGTPSDWRRFALDPARGGDGNPYLRFDPRWPVHHPAPATAFPEHLELPTSHWSGKTGKWHPCNRQQQRHRSRRPPRHGDDCRRLPQCHPAPGQTIDVLPAPVHSGRHRRQQDSRGRPGRSPGAAIRIVGWLSGRSDGSGLRTAGSLPDLPTW